VSSMDTISRFHTEIEELSERRVALWNSLSQGRDPAVVDEIKALDVRLEELWAKIRAERARIRFGERDEIVRRARAEERLERAA
jgi:FtsZ-binding cell division protein ZapB